MYINTLIIKTEELSSNKDELSECLYSGNSVKIQDVQKHHYLKIF